VPLRLHVCMHTHVRTRAHPSPRVPAPAPHACIFVPQHAAVFPKQLDIMTCPSSHPFSLLRPFPSTLPHPLSPIPSATHTQEHAYTHTHIHTYARRGVYARDREYTHVCCLFSVAFFLTLFNFSIVALP